MIVQCRVLRQFPEIGSVGAHHVQVEISAAVRAEQEPLRIRRPARAAIDSRLGRQPRQAGSIAPHLVQFDIAVAVAGKGEPLAIGRPGWLVTVLPADFDDENLVLSIRVGHP